MEEVIQQPQSQVNPFRNEYESAELGKLFEALAKAQAEMELAKQDSKNPFFKSSYADLGAVVKASRPYLAKNGLCVIQRVIPNGQGNYLHTRLAHASGQWMESKMLINPPKQDIQTIGSYITYLRRYSYAAMVGVVAAGEDDDGESAMIEVRKEGAKPATPKPGISKQQLEILAGELDGYEDLVEAILKGFGISKLADIPANQYTKCLEKIRKVKAAREE